MKKLIIFSLCGLALGLSHLDAADNKNKEKDNTKDTGYSVQLTWWASPQKRETYYISNGKDHLAVNPPVMSFTAPIHYMGEPPLVLTRKIEGKDSQGKPVITYEPAITVEIEKAGSKNVGVILFSNPQNGAIFQQFLNLSADAIPYGSFYLVNFSKAKIAATLNGATIKAGPGQKAKSDSFKEQNSIELSVVGQKSDGEVVSITNSQIALDSDTRILYFVGEKTIEGVTSYNVKTILDSNPNPPAPDAKTSEDKAKSDKSKSDKKSTKAAQ
jgi:hypothetical protein